SSFRASSITGRPGREELPKRCAVQRPSSAAVLPERAVPDRFLCRGNDNSSAGLRRGAPGGAEEPRPHAPQRYLNPVPVLKRTIRELGSSLPAALSFFAAAQTAPPSGATKSPSAAPISSLATRISSSVTVTASPPDARRSRRIR